MLSQHTARVPDEEGTNGIEKVVKTIKEKAISETKTGGQDLLYCR